MSFHVAWGHNVLYMYDSGLEAYMDDHVTCTGGGSEMLIFFCFVHVWLHDELVIIERGRRAVQYVGNPGREPDLDLTPCTEKRGIHHEYFPH